MAIQLRQREQVLDDKDTLSSTNRLWCETIASYVITEHKSISMRSLDADLFHPDSSEVFRRHQERLYKAHPIPIIPPVVIYFPTIQNETQKQASARIRTQMKKQNLWLNSEEEYIFAVPALKCPFYLLVPSM